jgi:hypothetical protein
VVICSNHVMLQDEVDVALTHELLHAYDHCRAANLDWTNCEHHACSEVCFSLFSFQQEKEFAVAQCQSLYVCANVEFFFLRVFFFVSLLKM